jgi:hypothetical protein
MYESTRIADGDLTPLLRLTRLIDLRMMNRQHYKPTVADVKRLFRIEGVDRGASVSG